MPSDSPLLDVRHLSKIYVTSEVRTTAVHDATFSIARGEYVSIAGPSGCGKSTLLSLLGLLDEPSSGEYALDGRSTASLSRAERARLRARSIGFVFQSFNLIGSLTARENVELALKYQHLPPAERRARAGEALETVGIAHRANHYPSQMSGGQQQRVAVARAIAGRPLIVLADEPTGNLDTESGANIMALLKGLHAEGSTLCVVTHDPRYADDATRVLEMLDGRIAGERRNDLRHGGSSRAGL